MSTALNEAKCPNCGRALPKGAPEGLCPACLLDAGGDTETAQGAGRKGFQPPPIDELRKLFPQLKILQLIGAGGMGAVYKARQPALDRLVALKILPPGSDEGVNFAERFNREARALARLSHPNIVAVHEFGRVENLHYFIMEYVDGTNLRQLERRGRLSPREALQIIPQICDALQYAHDEGVVHRDVKPENVLVDRKGRVKIADFGLAKILGIDAEQGRLTAEGQVMGTPHYMAPEQVERPLTVDHRADIYSLGVVFYEMLTGDLPIGKFAPPSRKVSVDVRLDEVVLRSLENDPSRRYQHASEVKSELETITDKPATSAPPKERPSASRTQTERHVYWAGIPLAVDRDGEREITWNGGLTAVCAALLLNALGMWLFRLVTGLPSPSLLGIPMLITILILGAGFRWALKVPLPVQSDLQRAANGTIILKPTRRRLNWTYLAMGSIAAAVFAWGFGSAYLLPVIKQQAGPSKTAQTARLHAADGTMSVDLPGRGRIELLAVAYADPAPNQWWRPDGSPITNELWQVENPGVASFSNALYVSTNRELILRTYDLPDDANGPSFEVDSQVGYVSGGYVLKGDTHIQEATSLRIAMRPPLKSLSLRAGFGLKPWRTIATKDLTRQSVSSEFRPGDPRWDPRFNSVSDTADGAQVTVVMDPENRAWSRRVVAVDTNGTEHLFASGTGTPSEGSATWTYTFRKLPLNQVREFRIQVRPVHWIEFKNIRLNPNQPPPPPHRVTFTPTHEITFSDFIDFDTGNVMAEPPGEGDNRHVFDSLGETVAWMERTGLDAAVGNGELQPLGMVFVALENRDWDAMTTTELTTKLHQGTFRPNALKPWKNGELPSTFGFRTREGGTGILQLLAFEEARPGVTLRYKLIKRPALPAL